METKSNNFPRKRKLEQQFLDLLLELLFLVEKAHMRGGLSGSSRKRQYTTGIPLGGHFFPTCFPHPFFHTKLRCSMKVVPKMDPIFDFVGTCFQKKKETRKVCFDCTGAYGLHVSPRPGTPKATQNPPQKTKRIPGTFCSTKHLKKVGK